MSTTITAIIKRYLDKQGITQSRLAEKLGASNRQGISQKLRGKDLSTSTVMEISSVLRYDFFRELSAQLRQEIAQTGATLQEPETAYGSSISYESLLLENIQLNRDLRATQQELERIKGIAAQAYNIGTTQNQDRA